MGQDLWYMNLVSFLVDDEESDRTFDVVWIEAKFTVMSFLANSIGVASGSCRMIHVSRSSYQKLSI